jgi:hypothetical protein
MRVVQRFWPGQDGVGKRIKLGSLESAAPWLQIVGVVKETRYRALPENPTAIPTSICLCPTGAPQVALVVRSTLPPAALAPSVRAAIRAIEPAIALYSVATMDELVESRRHAPASPCG